jgi:O-antigen/teichoic acid export membrane protein
MLLAVFGFLCVAVTAFASDLLAILTQPAYFGAAAAVPPLAIGMVAYASTSISSSGIGLMKRTSLLALASGLVAVLNVVLNLVLIPPYGMIGSAWATAISYITLSAVLLVVAQRLWPVRYEVRNSVLTIGLMALFTAAASMIPTALSLPGFLLKAGLCLAFVPMLFAIGALGSREVSAARTLFGATLARATGRRRRGSGR